MFNRLSWKLERAKRSYLKERVQQQQRLNEEFTKLEKLLRENAIEEDTYKRLRKLLEMGYQQKLQETRRKYGFPCNFVHSEAIPNLNSTPNNSFHDSNLVSHYDGCFLDS